MKPSDVAQRTQWVALSLSPHIGGKTLRRLLRHFDGDLSAICAATPRQLRQSPGIGERIAREISNIDLAAVAGDLQRWRAQGIRVLTIADADYPAPLRAAPDYPPTLFARGAFAGSLVDEGAIAIVGTRHPSPYAKSLALQLAMKLAREERVIVSGLALGIDAAAHSSALAAGGKTIAVLGSGVLRVYPAENKHIAERILKQGALISESHPMAAAKAQRLVSRNRIISGLCQSVVVVESDADAGAMHTARFARDQGRRVFTFRFPASGNLQLMREGAAVLPSDPAKALPYLLE